MKNTDYTINEILKALRAKNFGTEMDALEEFITYYKDDSKFPTGIVGQFEELFYNRVNYLDKAFNISQIEHELRAIHRQAK